MMTIVFAALACAHASFTSCLPKFATQQIEKCLRCIGEAIGDGLAIFEFAGRHQRAPVR